MMPRWVWFGSVAMDFHQYHLNSLIERIPRRGLVPFVGAGLSVPLGYPGWTTFLWQEAISLGVEQEIQFLTGKGHYEEAAETLERRSRHAFTAKIKDTFGVHRPFAEQDVAVRSLPRLTRGPVITTNFDSVLENVYAEAGRAFQRVFDGGQSQLIADAVQIGWHSLVKLHGDAGNDETRVLTKKEYRRQYCTLRGSIDYSKPLPKAMRWLFAGEVVLFIGCSLRNDRYLHILRRAVELLGFSKHFAILEEPPKSDQYLENKESRLRDLEPHNICPIWYPHGEHGCVREILEYLADKSGMPAVAGNTLQVDGAPQIEIPLKLVHGESLDLLSYLEENASKYEALAGSGFDKLRPKDMNGIAREFTISCVYSDVSVSAFPHFSGEDRRLVMIPTEGERFLDYWPRGGGSARPPGFSVRLTAGPPAIIEIREKDSPSVRAIVVKVECGPVHSDV